MKQFFLLCSAIFIFFSQNALAQIPVVTLAEIVKAEDERRYDQTLENLLANPNEKIRLRAALAAGRIGDERAIPALARALQSDSVREVRAVAAFAIGEIESANGAEAILKILRDKDDPEVRARAIEAAGKIAAANAKDARALELGKAILLSLETESSKQTPDRLTILLGLTAVLRARPEGGAELTAKFLSSPDARIRADALNALARLRAKNANEKARQLLQSDNDAIVRANAARVLGAAEDKDAFEMLLKAATTDADSRVRVSAVRSLGSLKEARVADGLIAYGETLLNAYKKTKQVKPQEKNQLLEIAATLGRLLPNSNNERAVRFLDEFRYLDNYESPEIEIAFAQISPTQYLKSPPRSETEAKNFWKQISSTSQGMAEFSKMEDKGRAFNPGENPEDILKIFIKVGPITPNKKDITRAIPDVLRSYAAFKTNDLSTVLREHLKYKDVVVRATAASLLGEQTASRENIEALKTAFIESLKTDKNDNDAQLAILSALVKLDKPQSFESLRLALKSPDYLVRRHAANLIKANDLTKDFSNIEKMVGTVKLYNPAAGTKLGQVFNSEADYRRALSRKNARAIITTAKGAFTIEFFPEAAPLTVDNFIKLARAGYYNNLTIHRVVPNFVVQDGDPRGDGSGGPGWTIRCEINQIQYERGIVGMALSGKDTGGSQWFVTHSPQPHLDGGYTVFGRVNPDGMKIVDNLARGDVVLSVRIVEGNARPKIKGRKPAR